MKKLPFIVGFIFAFGISSFGQTNTTSPCPIISIDGPAGIVAPGEIATYIARIANTERPRDLVYIWSTSAGGIVSGQGTTAISVRQPKSQALTVTLEVKGFPAGCPNVASESAIWDPAPQAIKLDSFGGPISHIAKDRFEKIKKAMLLNRNSQLLIFMVYRKGAGAKEIEGWRNAIFSSIPTFEEDYRITAVAAGEATNNFVEIWLVPPGANLPQCELCGKRVETAKVTCPTITISGPTEIVDLGNIVTFVSTISGVRHTNLRYRWDVSKGNIISGQQTQSIRVRVPKKSDGYVLTAVLKVAGLPRTCPTVASQNGLVAARFTGDPLDDYGPLSLDEENVRLVNAARALRSNPSYRLFILKYFEKPDRRNSQNIRDVFNFLTRSAKISTNRFKIKSAIGRRDETILWLVAPGSDEPQL